MASLAELFKDYKKDEEKKERKIITQKPKTTKTKSRPKKVQVKRERIKSETIVITKDELRELLKEAVREGIKIAREPNPRNVVEAIWNSEPSGVKLSNLVIVFGREKAKEIQNALDDLLRRNIIVKDRNGWHHINPLAIEAVLNHYGIPYNNDEPATVRTRIRHRFGSWNFSQPQF